MGDGAFLRIVNEAKMLFQLESMAGSRGGG